MLQEQIILDDADLSADEGEVLRTPYSDAQNRIHLRLGKHLKSRKPGLDVEGSTIELEPEQIAALRGIHAQMGRGEKAMYVEAPTGFGKMITIIKLLEMLTMDNPNLRVLIAVPDLDALNQWRDKFEEFAPHLAAKLGFYYGDEKDTDKQIIVATMASTVITQQKKIFRDNHFDLAIIDEGHQGLSDLRSGVLNKSWAIRIALSATPSYTQTRSLNRDYVPAYRCSPMDAEKKGLISAAWNIIMGEPEVVLDEGVLNKTGGYKQEEIARRAKALNKHFLDFYRNGKQPHNSKPFFGTQGFINCFNIADANGAAAAINADLRGHIPDDVIGAASINNHTSAEVRRSLVRRYNEGKILMLTGVGLLTQSIHSPRTAFVFNRAPSTSGVRVGQRGGRGRSVPRGPGAKQKMAYIIDVLYRNTSARCWQLLYGEWVSGTLVDDSRRKMILGRSSDEPGGTRRGTFDLDLLQPGAIITDRRQIAALYRARARHLAKLRPAPQWSRDFPRLWAAMKNNDVFNIRELANRMSETFGKEYKPHTVLNLVNGTTDFYDKKLLQWHPTCVDIARFLNRHVSDLFPIKNLNLPATANPDSLRRADNRARFEAMLQEEGHEGSLSGFAKKHGLNPMHFHSFVSEGNAHGPQGWKNMALQIADILGRSLEDIFGIPEEIELDYKAAQYEMRERTDAVVHPDISEAERKHADDEFDVTLNTLTPREERAIRARYGIGVRLDEGTYEELAPQFGEKGHGVTRSRVGQIITKAEWKLKQHSRKPRLRALFDLLKG
ncbi:MAG: DEAD/DEAH box helicase family protein [Proteobacteria bacterium]|nr:DEAD/DEAH box helicase family protein [Pseudomonadota bacterium]